MNLAAVIADHVKTQPDRPAIDSGSVVLSYGELDELVRRISHRLKSAGLQTGDLVGTRLMDTPRHVAALLAIARTGAITLPIDWRSTPPEVRRLTESFSPRAIVTDNEQPLGVDRPEIRLDGIDSEPLDSEPPVDLADAPLVYALTSGTTGQSKGVVVTHEEMYERFLVFSQESMMMAEDRFLPAMPLAYAAGREFHLSLLVCGATLVMGPTLFDAAELVALVKDRGVTVLMVSPNVSRRLLALQGDAAEPLLPQLRAYVSSTGKLTPEERSAIRVRITPGLIDFYGSTGSGPISVIAGPADETGPTSAGRISARIDLEISDPQGNTVDAGQVGAIRLRGPRITKRFVGDADPSSESIKDGWYYLGDLGAIDEQGLLHLHGRSADLIKRGGLMVHAQEVERILMLHEAVEEAAVIGIPSAELGEEVGAFIVPKRPARPRELILHCSKHLAPHKVPVRIETIDALPRNANGKVQKARLKERLQV
jgi:acyl-CoA synthetase (AMP-forming)/AMP-acid ligase II